ncbi:MAG: YCF48-related protein [Ignavibacteriae bacterium]|nr:YCF48-related protein [Ignavibacteriota bacterium]
MENERKSNLAKSKIADKLSTYLFYASILIFLIAFNFQDSRTGGWYQQWLPNLNGEQLKDITFLDSLTGYGITNSYIIKTTNGGDNWVINATANLLFSKVQFINKDTGYVSAGLNKLYKTFNGGNNWTIITLPADLYPISMYVLNKDTLWLCDNEGLTGGLFKSTNGGYNWFNQFYALNYNPERIYMYNDRIGFLDKPSKPQMVEIIGFR